VRLHLDTDLGTTIDDFAALVMVLGTPGVELTGITTSIDPGGRRAGYVRYVLGLAGRNDIPVVAGAEVSMTTLAFPGHLPDHDRYWPEPVTAAPSPAGSALRLLAGSIDAGATIVALGPCTNLALLGVDRPDVLARARVVAMGGWFDPASEGLPAWGPARDWNVQCDPTSADVVVAHAGDVTLVPLSLTMRTSLRRSHLARLQHAGPLGRLLAHQAQVQAVERSTGELARAHGGLPDDLLAFHHDPLTCAVALGWPGLALEQRRLVAIRDEDSEVLHFVESQQGQQGRLVSVGADVDADAFSTLWLASVETAERRRSTPPP
jgi:purine nucleosidase